MRRFHCFSFDLVLFLLNVFMLCEIDMCKMIFNKYLMRHGRGYTDFMISLELFNSRKDYKI